MTRRNKALEASVTSVLDQQQRNLDQEIEHIWKEIGNLIGYLSSLPYPEDVSLKELQGSVKLFRQFAVVYVESIRKLANNDQFRISSALNKIQSEIFVLRRLIEQRWSPNLYPALRLADIWATAYLESLLQTKVTPGHGLEGDLSLEPRLLRRHVATQAIRDEEGGDAEADVVPDAEAQGIAPRQPNLSNQCLTFLDLGHYISLGVLVYNRNPSIGLPLMHAHEPWHWFGMAHEVGHFVFHNCTLDGAPLDFAFRKEIFTVLTDSARTAAAERVHGVQTCMDVATSIPLWCRWAEELFADTLGAVTLGPAYIESLMLWMAPQLPDARTLLHNNGDHPVACLRPILQLLVLLHCLGAVDEPPAAPLGDELASLADRWFDFCEKRFIPTRPRRRPERSDAGPGPVSLATVNGVKARLETWKKAISHTAADIPLDLLLDQACDVAEGCHPKLLWADRYDAQRHAAIQAAAANAEVLAAPVGNQKALVRLPLEQQRDLLGILWYRHQANQIARGAMTPQQLLLCLQAPDPAHAPAIDRPVQQRLEDLRNAITPSLLREMLEPLFLNDPRWGEGEVGIATVLDCWEGIPREEARSLADWLLHLLLALTRHAYCITSQGEQGYCSSCQPVRP